MLSYATPRAIRITPTPTLSILWNYAFETLIILKTRCDHVPLAPPSPPFRLPNVALNTCVFHFLVSDNSHQIPFDHLVVFRIVKKKKTKFPR